MTSVVDRLGLDQEPWLRKLMNSLSDLNRWQLCTYKCRRSGEAIRNPNDDRSAATVGEAHAGVRQAALRLPSIRGFLLKIQDIAFKVRRLRPLGDGIQGCLASGASTPTPL